MDLPTRRAKKYTTQYGGRVASTALATLSLEVYYRILPMYGFRGDEEAAPEVKIKGQGELDPDEE